MQPINLTVLKTDHSMAKDNFNKSSKETTPTTSAAL